MFIAMRHIYARFKRGSLLRLAHMTQRTEATQAWLGQITHQIIMISYQDQNKHLGGPIGLLKPLTTPCVREVADDACNVFGDRGVTLQ
jgi:hypothetical protein